MMSWDAERLEKLAAMGDAAEPLVELAGVRMREGRYGEAMRLLQRAQGIEDTRRARSMIGQLENKHQILCVERRDYVRLTKRFEHQARGASSWTRSQGFSLPGKNRKRAIILHHLLSALDTEREYSGSEIDGVLQGAAQRLLLQVDHCHLRRYMQALGMLTRTQDGRAYWLSPDARFVLMLPEPKPERPLVYVRDRKGQAASSVVGWLRVEEVEAEVIDVMEGPLSERALVGLWRRSGGRVEALVNTGHRAYAGSAVRRAMSGGEGPEGVLSALARTPEMLSVPALDAVGGACVGFDVERWGAVLGA